MLSYNSVSQCLTNYFKYKCGGESVYLKEFLLMQTTEFLMYVLITKFSFYSLNFSSLNFFLWPTFEAVMGQIKTWDVEN